MTFEFPFLFQSRYHFLGQYLKVTFFLTAEPWGNLIILAEQQQFTQTLENRRRRENRPEVPLNTTENCVVAFSKLYKRNDSTLDYKRHPKEYTQCLKITHKSLILATLQTIQTVRKETSLGDFQTLCPSNNHVIVN